MTTPETKSVTAPETKAATKKTFHFPKAAGAAAPAKKAKSAEASTASKPRAKKADVAAAPAKRTTPAKRADEVVVAGTAQEEKQKRAKKEKVVRDSFTMPKSDYTRLASLKQKCLTNGVHIKKSELLRAGLLMLEAASDKNLLAAVKSVETIKTGRPAKA
jgi:hypothetical protein